MSLPEIIEPARARELLESATAILDHALATGDATLGIHIHACQLADELIFSHLANRDIADAFSFQRKARAHRRLHHAATQLKLWHLDRLDRHLSLESH